MKRVFAIQDARIRGLGLEDHLVYERREGVEHRCPKRFATLSDESNLNQMIKVDV
jgi:hypothetical protein